MSSEQSDSIETKLLTPGQRRLVGFALGFIALVVSIALLVGVMWVLSFIVRHFSGVLWPLAVAGILAMILRPVVELFESRWKLPRVGAVILLYAAFLMVVAGILFFITPRLVGQLIDGIEFLPTFWPRAVQYLQLHYPDWVALADNQMKNPMIQKIVASLKDDWQAMDWQTVLGQSLLSIKSAAGQGLVSLVLGIVGVCGFFTHLAVVPIYLFFFLLSSREPTKNLGQHLGFLKPGLRDDVVFLVGEFITIVVSFFRGQLLIGLIMGALLAIGFSIVGLKFGLVIGLALGILNIVPYLGTILGLGVALPLAFLQPGGGPGLVGLVLAVFCLVQMTEGWFLTPQIMGKRTGLHPVTIIVAIFFWGTALNSILGMVLAIPLTAFFVTAWRLAKRKYFNLVARGAEPTSTANPGA